MVVPGSPKWSLRLERVEVSRLAWAFGISLAFHLLVFGGIYAGHKYHLWDKLHWPAWLESVKKLADSLKKQEHSQPPPQQPEAPLLFVDVSSAQESAEPPKEAKYYSDRNSRAANPETSADSNVPRINGKQTEVPRTEDVPRKVYTPLQPAPPVPLIPPTKVTQEELKPRAALPPGDLAMAKPTPEPPKDPGEAPHQRPRTIQEAKARQPENKLRGEKMKQEGGVRRYHEITGLDVKATVFGAYDAAFIAAVQQRWDALLEQQAYAFNGQGKVVLQFTLHYDGRISEMGQGENTAGFKWGLICEQAVQDPAPFASWNAEMRRLMGNTRNIQITFIYY
jgi:hypothetical protein